MNSRMDLFGNGVDRSILFGKSGSAQELSHWLLSLNSFDSWLERKHAGHNDAGAENKRGSCPLLASRFGDGAAGKKRRAFRFYENHGSAVNQMPWSNFFNCCSDGGAGGGCCFGGAAGARCTFGSNCEGKEESQISVFNVMSSDSHHPLQRVKGRIVGPPQVVMITVLSKNKTNPSYFGFQ